VVAIDCSPVPVPCFLERRWQYRSRWLKSETVIVGPRTKKEVLSVVTRCACPCQETGYLVHNNPGRSARMHLESQTSGIPKLSIHKRRDCWIPVPSLMTSETGSVPLVGRELGSQEFQQVAANN
jgi:hypothetical protein